MATSLLWTPPENNPLHQLTTIVMLEFKSFLNSDGCPLDEAATVLKGVLSSVSKLPGWDCTQWGPRSNEKHGVVVLISAQFLRRFLETIN